MGVYQFFYFIELAGFALKDFYTYSDVKKDKIKNMIELFNPTQNYEDFMLKIGYYQTNIKPLLS